MKQFIFLILIGASLNLNGARKNSGHGKGRNAGVVINWRVPDWPEKINSKDREIELQKKAQKKHSLRQKPLTCGDICQAGSIIIGIVGWASLATYLHITQFRAVPN